MYGVKAIGMAIKAVSNDGIFEGYLSKFNEEDHEEDIVEKGAFTKTLAEKGPKRPLLWQHYAWEPVGILVAKQDDQGLLIQGNINLEVQRGKEAYALVKQGAVTGLSQGFRTIRSRQRPNSKGRFLEELDLWEGSFATFPALQSAQILSVRSTLPPWRHAALDQALADEQRAAAVERLARIAQAAGIGQA